MDRKLFKREYAKIREDIFHFCKTIKFYPTENQQADLLRAVMRGESRIACRSGQGPGKTTVSVVVGLWRLLRFTNGRLIVTAPTMRQCKEVWLGEVETVLGRAPRWVSRLFKVTNTAISVAGRKPKIWGCLTITATKSTNAQGQHRQHMDVIMEEASGISREMIQQFKGTLTNPNSLLLLIGNPNTRDCEFFDCFYGPDQESWCKLHWNAEETPESAWYTRKTSEDLAREFGRDSDIYRVRVLGEFPQSSPECIMSDVDVQACMDRSLFMECVKASNLKRFGMDFARFGGDECVVYQRSGNAIIDWKAQARIEPEHIVQAGFKMQADSLWRDTDCTYVADAHGMGQGVLNTFHKAGKNVVEFYNHSSASSAHYADRITEAWFRLAKKVKAREVCLPKDNLLKVQLSTRKYALDNKGKIKIEKKDVYKERMGQMSPDRADALVLAFYDGGGTTAKVARG